MRVWKLEHRSSQTSRLCCVFAGCLKHLYAATHFILIKKEPSVMNFALIMSVVTVNIFGVLTHAVCRVRALANPNACSQMPVEHFVQV